MWAAVKTFTGTRELITLDVAGGRILGTFHKPHAHRSASTPPIGVLFMHPGTLPRSAYGDAAVFWADAFAARGYPCFRFDLPGLGDSNGELPEKLLDFQSSVNEGEYAIMVPPLTHTIVGRFNLAGVVLVGLCAGAVTALYAAAVDEHVKGLVLMDPYFNLQGERTRPSGAGAFDADGKDAQTSGWQANLPSTANFTLIRCWNRVAASKRPILVLRSSSSKPKSGAFDYLGHLLQESRRGSSVGSISIDGTNHSFAEYGGKEAVRQHAEHWLNVNFSVAAGTESEVAAQQCAGIRELTDRHHSTLLPV
jgi:pimeloyl-ACP methyl ester carboxylesterase